ncbi:MAG: DUF222 domain-containing protein [Acidimicrobiales bacterium]
MSVELMSGDLMSGDEVFAAEDRMAELVGVANAATAALCAEVAGIIEREGWGDLSGAVRSPEHYVGWRTGFSYRHAREITTIARRWGDLPECQALFVAGSIGEDKMAMVARLVPAERDGEVARQATVMSFAQLAKVCRCVPKDPPCKPQREPSVSFFNDDERNEFVLRANTDLDTGAVITKGLEAARDDLFRMRFPDAPDGRVARDGVTWVEALEHLAELGLRALDPAVRGGGRPGDRYQVFLHLNARDAGRPVISTLHLGPVIRDSLARYLACDSTVAPVVYDGDRLVGVFPKERIVNDRLRRHIEQRDGGCRAPGCTQKR